MLSKHFLKIVLYYLLLVIGLVLILGGYLWYLNKQKIVGLNLARPNFPYLKYSVEELEQMYPQYPNENVATTQTPEETYAKFIQALKNGEVEEVEKLFYNNKYDKYRKIIEDKIIKNEVDELLKILDSKLILKSELLTFAQYRLENQEGENYIIEFIKDSDGVWKIDSL